MEPEREPFPHYWFTIREGTADHLKRDLRGGAAGLEPVERWDGRRWKTTTPQAAR